MLWLLPILVRRGISDTLAKPLAWLANIAIVAALLFGAVWYVRNVILTHDASIASDAAADRDRDITTAAVALVANAMETADANQMARDDTDATNDKELTNAASKGDDGAVGPGTRAVLERLRDQQAAGRR